MGENEKSKYKPQAKCIPKIYSNNFLPQLNVPNFLLSLDLSKMSVSRFSQCQRAYTVYWVNQEKVTEKTKWGNSEIQKYKVDTRNRKMES